MLKRKSKTNELSFSEKVIIDTLIKSLGVSARDDVLEISANGALKAGGAFNRCGANVFYASSVLALDGGIFDYVFIFNFPYNKILAEVVAAKNHVEEGKIILLNTSDILTDAQLKKAAESGSLISCVTNGEFSLAVIE